MKLNKNVMMLPNIKYLTDENGERTAVVIDIKDWQNLQEELDRLGISQDMLDAAQEIGVALERSAEGLQASQDSLDTQQRLAKRMSCISRAIRPIAKRLVRITLPMRLSASSWRTPRCR